MYEHVAHHCYLCDFNARMLPFSGTCPLIEYQALQRELDERNAQRDELLFRVKVGYLT